MVTRLLRGMLLASLWAGTCCPQVTHAEAIRLAQTGSQTLSANDDGSTGPVGLGFTLNFFGQHYSHVFVNNNGNVTFTGPLAVFTPFGLTSTNTPIIAPFFADVDTRGTGSGVVTYGASTLNDHAAFAVNWDGVGYYNQGADRLNRFQLLLVDRSDTGTGNFDIEFNYDQIQWESGSASGGSGGLGGSSARAGWSNGLGTFHELAGSGVPGAFLDDGPDSLILHSLNSPTSGRYLFQARNGQISTTPGNGTATPTSEPVPEPASLLLLGSLLAGGGWWLRRK